MERFPYARTSTARPFAHGRDSHSISFLYLFLSYPFELLIVLFPPTVVCICQHAIIACPETPKKICVKSFPLELWDDRNPKPKPRCGTCRRYRHCQVQWRLARVDWAHLQDASLAPESVHDTDHVPGHVGCRNYLHCMSWLSISQWSLTDSQAIPQIVGNFHSVLDIGWYGAAYQLAKWVERHHT